MKQGEGVRNKENRKKILQILKKDWVLYLFVGNLMLWFLIWVYAPMTGLILAFKDYDALLGINKSEFVGLANFQNLIFGSFNVQFWRSFRNTFIISLYGLIFSFPIPIILAILFSDIGNEFFRKITQTITYLPHFISEVTITGLVIFLVYKSNSTTGIMAEILYKLGWVENGAKILDSPQYFRPLYIITGLWKETGYSSIVYFAAIMGISPTLYEAIKVDGGNKFQELRYVTIPGMSGTLIVMLIMRIGRMLNVGYERIILLYNANTYETADIINSFVYRMGVVNGNTSLGTAAGMFNAIIGFALVIGANYIGRKVSNTSLW